MKKLKKFYIFSLLLAALSFSSCLHIIEEITIRKDGSGTYAFKIDASEISKMVGGMGKKMGITSDSSTTVTPSTPDTTKTGENSHQRVMANLKGQIGIQNVLAIEDSVNYITGYSFDFDNVGNMRDAIKRGSVESTMGLWSHESDVILEKKAFRRKSGSDTFTKMFMELMQQKSEEDGREMSGSEGIMRMMFGSLSFKQIYHFPDRKIKGSNDSRAVLSTDKHSLSILTKPFSSDEKAKKAPSELNIRLQ